ncbi:MAG: hypothetical protein KGJ36_08250, partial [Acidobacteriota bacterium]|nr:hypothetical protein [Acidobacteriota bacterium]
MGARARVALYRAVGAVSEALPVGLDVRVGRRVARALGRRAGAPRENLRVNLRHALGAPGADVDPALLER